MGAVTIKFPADKYQQLINGHALLPDLLIDLFSAEPQRKNIITQLQNYHSDEDGAPIVPEFAVTDAEFNAQTYSGKVRFAYPVDYTFACADKRATTRNTETADFTINPNSETLTLLIHDKISRDTLEEF